MKDNPNIDANLVKIQQERESLQDLLTRTIQNLEDGTFKTLVSQVRSDRNEQAKLNLVRREKETTATVKRLKEELIREQEEHKMELAARKNKIAELKEELQDINQERRGETNYMRKSTSKDG